MEKAIKATLVEDKNRPDFLSAFFGAKHKARGANLVFRWKDTLMRNCGWVLWNFYTLDNGGFYLAPHLATPLDVSVALNGFRGEVSADAAGIIVTLFVLNQLMSDLSDREDEDIDHLIERYHLLRDFASQHAEARLIYKAID